MRTATLASPAGRQPWPVSARADAGRRRHRHASPRAINPAANNPRPWTDGRHCVGNHADYDGNVSNGCEAAPDTLDGSTIHGQVRANLVPADDTDTYRFHVSDHFQFTCDGQIHVTLTAPSQVSERLVVLRGSEGRGDRGKRGSTAGDSEHQGSELREQ